MLKYRDENFSNYIRGLTVPPNPIKYTIFGSLCVKTVKIQVKLVKYRRNKQNIAEFAKIPLPPFSKMFHCISRTRIPHTRKKNFEVISHRKKVSVTISGAWRPSWIFEIARNAHPQKKTTPAIFQEYILENQNQQRKKLVHENPTGIWYCTGLPVIFWR